MFSRFRAQLLEEPPAAFGSFSTELNGLHYFWRGWGPGRTTTTIRIFDLHNEQWSQHHTTGPPPPGLFIGCCKALNEANELYTFGGYNGSSYYDRLHKLKLKNNSLQWVKVKSRNNPSEWPIHKAGCGLVSVGEGAFACFGGHGIGPTQPGSTFVRDMQFPDGSGWTNEFHIFDVTEGIWSSPCLTGARPPPSSFFSFTNVDQKKAILFGGRQPCHGRVSDLYVFNFSNMEVSRIKPVQGEAWPPGRSGHAACCLNYGGDHPKLLVSGGVDDNKVVLQDMWILDVDSSLWMEVTLPEMVRPRYGHSLTATSLGSGLSEVLVFGGSLEWPKCAKTPNDYSPITGTTVLRFESLKLDSSGNGNWELVDVACDNTRGSSQRLREKMVKIRQAALHPTTERETSGQSLRDQLLHSSQDRVRSLEEQLQAAEQRVQDIQLRAAQQLEEVNYRFESAEQRAAEATHQVQTIEPLLGEAIRSREEAEGQIAESNHRLRQTQELSDQRAMLSERRIQELTNDNRRLQEELQQMTRRVHLAEQRAEGVEMNWVVHYNEIQMTERELGGGGWGVVKIAKFRGIEVAAKSLYEQIQSNYYRQLFIREMNMAARLRHPNLVQFIGATLEGEMIILTELMATSLRRVLEEGGISRENIISITIQVCQALSYLHLMQPDPVIHRDISSANVLLNPLPNNIWLAKVTDYGSVNTLQALQTENPGNPVYAAPESRVPSLQSTKMDMFSVGVLLIEMCTGQFPSDRLEDLLLTVHNHRLIDVIRRCVDQNRDNRPSALELMTELQKFVQ